MKQNKENKTAPAIIQAVDDHTSRKLKQLKEKCLYMYATKEPFELTKSGTSYKLDSALFKAKARRGGFTPTDLNFIKAVKKHVIDNSIPDQFIYTDYRAQKINYIDVKSFDAGTVLKGYVEIDIDAAYWWTAYILGIIDKRIFKLGLSNKIEKIVRLAALGSLAKRTQIWVFNGKTMRLKEEIRSFITENLWFAICKRMADVMGEAAKIAGDDFAFFWVDGIYLENNPDTIKKIQDYFTSCGYNSKVKQTEKITFTDFSFKVDDVERKDDNDFREFTYPRDNRIKTIREYNEDMRLKQFAEEVYLGLKKVA